MDLSLPSRQFPRAKVRVRTSRRLFDELTGLLGSGLTLSAGAISRVTRILIRSGAGMSNKLRCNLRFMIDGLVEHAERGSCQPLTSGAYWLRIRDLPTFRD
jgi:hypothetical protein